MTVIEYAKGKQIVSVQQWITSASGVDVPGIIYGTAW